MAWERKVVRGVILKAAFGEAADSKRPASHGGGELGSSSGSWKPPALRWNPVRAIPDLEVKVSARNMAADHESPVKQPPP